MGTNFYLVKKLKECNNDMNPECHIGKRSAAGLYCWDCGVTLCKGSVHYDDGWYDKCPKCGKKPKKETLDNGAAGRELGFNKSKPAPKTGVKSCSSFRWDMEPDNVLKMKCRAIAKPICDEYGRKYTLKEFKEILEECPIIFTDSIGKDFC